MHKDTDSCMCVHKMTEIDPSEADFKTSYLGQCGNAFATEMLIVN